MDQIKQLIRLARDPKQSQWVSNALLAGDALLCAAIIARVSYTEIDWKAYMQQVEIYLKGERNYQKIYGATGPLVYPGLHVYIYCALYAVTNGGRNILVAQAIFALLYLGTLVVVMACYRNAKAPPYIFPLLILSKRLHSIFMLRLFNDCFTILFLWTAIFFYQTRRWSIGSTFLTGALGVKMNALLAIPGIAFVLLQAIGLDRSITQALLVVQVQGLFAYEFVKYDWRAYLTRAFELNRQFLYKWTVNWRFVPEDLFLSPTFAYSLLAAHVGLLLVFSFTRWTSPSRRSLPETLRLFLRQPNSEAAEAVSARVSADFVLTTILTANAIGMLFARSLHYQFYSWIAWSTPWLLWRSGLGPVFVVGVWAAQEWAWNVYPSTDTSSIVVVGCLALQVLGVFWSSYELEKSGHQRTLTPQRKTGKTRT